MPKTIKGARVIAIKGARVNLHFVFSSFMSVAFMVGVIIDEDNANEYE